MRSRVHAAMRSRGHALTRGLLLAVLLLTSLRAATASAHALLLRSSPAADADLSQPPPTIELWFTEPLEPSFSGARLFDSTGQELEVGAVVLDPADPTHLSLPVGQLGPGIYTVAWQTLSQADGHEWYGSFPFTVLNSDGSRPSGAAAEVGGAGRGELPLPAEVALRWLALMGGLLALGGPLFARRVAPRDPPALTARVAALALPVLWVGLVVALTGGLGQVVVQSLRLGGLEQLPEVLLGTRTGGLVLGRMTLAATVGLISLWLPLPERVAPVLASLRLGAGLLLAVLGGLLAWAGAQGEPLAWLALAAAGLGLALAALAQRGARPDRLWTLLSLLAAVMLLGHSLSSHAGAVPGSLWAVLGDYVHLLAAAAWVGGLVMLAGVLWIGRANEGPGPRLDLWPVVRRFSILASAAVFVLALTGLFNSLVQLPALDSLWTTAYGRVLLLKLGLVAAALGLAFLNNRLVHARSLKLPEPQRLAALGRQVRVEVGVALALMVSVAALVQTPAPRFQAQSAAYQPQLPYTTTTSADDLYIHAQVAPNVAGVNRFWLHLYHEAGTPIGEVQLVRLLFNYRDLSLGQSSVDLEALGQNTFQAEGAYLNQPGNWDVSIYVRRRGLDDTLAQFSVVVPAPADALAGSTPWQNPVPAAPAAWLAAGVLLAVGLIPLLWRGPLGGLRRWRLAQVQLAGGVALVGAFALSVAGVIEWRNRPPAQVTNPIPALPESLALGLALYQDNCLPCHGPVGLGDGPVGRTLRPPPANLQVHMVPGVHADAQIYEWISNGFPNSPMPAFAEVLSEDERWHILNYIRTLVPSE